MIESLIVLGKVAVVCGIGFAVATGFEWFSDMEVRPRNKTIQIGQEKKNKGVRDNDNKIEHLKQRVRSAS